MRRYGAPHRVIVSSLNCHAGLNHALGMVQSSVTVQRRGNEAMTRYERLIASAHYRKTVMLNVPILKHALV